MTPTITMSTLMAACSPGGSSCLASVTNLVPAGGAQSAVSPAKFTPERGSGSVYAFEPRYLDGELRTAVVIDSKQSQLNRMEAALALAVEDGSAVLSLVPRITVVYARDGGSEVFSDLTLPHRAFDGHIRLGTIDGRPVVADPRYRALRDCTPADARALLETSPVTLVFGGWDSTRARNQGRWRSAMVGEIVGFCSEEDRRRTPRRGGARVDPVGMQVQVTGTTLAELADSQAAELSSKKLADIRKEANKAKANPVSASALVVGGIPPALSQLAGIACDAIVRSHVLSFAALRQIRFGAGPTGDVACRAVLAALALNGLARSDAELHLRANCDLVEADRTVVTLDRRGGEAQTLTALGVDQADELLAAAIDVARELADLRWEGQVLEVVGNPAIIAGALADDGQAE